MIKNEFGKILILSKSNPGEAAQKIVVYSTLSFIIYLFIGPILLGVGGILIGNTFGPGGPGITTPADIWAYICIIPYLIGPIGAIIGTALCIKGLFGDKKSASFGGLAALILLLLFYGGLFFVIYELWTQS